MWTTLSMFAENFISWSRQSAFCVSSTACMLGHFFHEEHVENIITCWNWAIWAYGCAEYVFGSSVFIIILVFLCSTGLIYPVKCFFYAIWSASCLFAGKILELLQYMWRNRSGIKNWLTNWANRVSVPNTNNFTAATPVVEPLPMTLPVRTPTVVPDPNQGVQYLTSAMQRVATRQQTRISQSGTMPQPTKKSSMAPPLAILSKNGTKAKRT